MKPIAQFKAELGVTSIALMQGKGRMFANIGDKSIIVGKDTDMKKPLFVFYNEGKGIHVICNASAKVVAEV